MMRIAGQRGERHIRPIAGPKNADPFTVDPIEIREVIGRRQAVFGVGYPPHSTIGPLKISPVGGAAPEVDPEPGVSLLDEILGVAVPLIPVDAGRPTVGIDNCGEWPVAVGFEEKAVELELVK
jgi:hypothetical protein